jgi:hypothetical protein
MNRPRRRTSFQNSHPFQDRISDINPFDASWAGDQSENGFPEASDSNSKNTSRISYSTSVQRTHFVSRSTTPIGSAGGPVRGPMPLPMSQTSSWGGSLAVIPTSAKNWARTAHLHDVKSVKKRLEQGRESTGKSERGMATDVEHDDEVFFWSLTRQPSASMALDDAPVLSTQRSSFELGVVQDFCSHYQNIRFESSTAVALVSPTEDESNPWVDTDSASADDGNRETFGFPHPKSVVPLL